jgi:DNA mismatch repair protein MutH
MGKKFTSKEEVNDFAQGIIGKKFGNLAPDKKITQKNYVGDIFEEWFGKKKDSDSKPDLGVVELKTIPYQKLKKGNFSSQERLVLNIINYNDLVNEEFESSHFIQKNKTLEIGFYQYFENNLKNEWSFSHTVLYEMERNKKDYEIIKNDWKIIQQYVREGRAEELSESLTVYLSACTKGGKGGNPRKQPFSSVMAKQRAFSLKQGYMTRILRHNVLGHEHNDSIIKSSGNLKNKSVSKIIIDKLNKFIGKSTEELMVEFNFKSKSKNLNNQLIRRMLNLDDKEKQMFLNNELKKAMIFLKTVEFNKNGYNKDNMSFLAFDFEDICKQHWTDEGGNPSADINVMFSEGTIAACVFQKDNSDRSLFKGVQFFSISKEDIDGDIKHCWNKTISVLNSGVVLTYKKTENGHRVLNNLPKKSENKIIHVKLHTRESSYVKNSYSSKLPTKAQWQDKPEEYSEYYMTKQSFFLNNTYVKSKVKDLLD